MIKHYSELEVYELSYNLALEVCKLANKLPQHEIYSLGDQLRRAARSIPANVAEGWSKRKYPKLFKRHLLDALGSCDEVQVHLSFARDLGYVDELACEGLYSRYDIVGKKLYTLHKSWKKF